MDIFVAQVLLALVMTFGAGLFVGRQLKKQFGYAFAGKGQEPEEIVSQQPYVKGVMTTSLHNDTGQYRSSSVSTNPVSTHLSTPDLVEVTDQSQSNNSTPNSENPIQQLHKKIWFAINNDHYIKRGIANVDCDSHFVETFLDNSSQSITIGTSSFGKVGTVLCDVARNGMIAVDGNITKLNNQQVLYFEEYDMVVSRNGLEYTFLRVRF